MNTMGFMTGSGGGRYSRAPRRVTSSALHKDTRSTLDLLHSEDEVAVTHYNEVEAIIVSPGHLQDLKAAAAHAEEINTVMPMLLAAAQTKVALPSEFLDRYLEGGESDWRAIAEFAATFPLTLHAGEDGEPITRARLGVSAANLDESGTDDELNLD